MPTVKWRSLLMIFIVGSGLALAGVWQTSHADVDGDGVIEGIDYVIGENGEQNIPYQYGPHAHIIAWNTSRTCSGLYHLRQVIYHSTEILLDTGEPTLHNQGWFSYEDTYYDSMTTHISGNDITTRWVSDQAVLERIVNLNDDRAVNRYRLWVKKDGGLVDLGQTAFINDWNNGMPTIEQAKNYVLTRNSIYKACYLDTFPGLFLPDDYAFKIVYLYDDFARKQDTYSILAWDGYNGSQPDTRTIWGVVHLPEPCSLFCESAPACCGRTYVFWRGHGANQLVAGLNIKPEVINLKSQGAFTGFITPPAGYDPGLIDIASLVCCGARAVSAEVTPGVLIAKFNVQDIIGIGPGSAVEFLLTGQFLDGTSFFGVDTVRIIEPPELVITLSILPNPCQKVTVLTQETNEPTLTLATRFLIYDGAGRIVRALSAESGTTIWNLCDQTGNRVPAGVYFVQSDAAPATPAKKIIVVR